MPQFERIPGEPNEEQILQWKAQYGENSIYRLAAPIRADDADEEAPPEEVVVVYCRKPNPVHLSRFTEAAMSKKAFQGLRQLVDDTRLWPAAEAVKKLAEDKPGLILTLGGQLQKLVGIDVNFTVTRL